MTQLLSFLRILLTAVRTGRLGLLPVKFYRGNNAVFVSVDLIGEKNQVTLYRITYISTSTHKLKQIKKLWNAKMTYPESIRELLN